MSLSIADFFIIASILQGLFIGLMILFKSAYQSKANNYLGVSILLLSIICFLGVAKFRFFLAGLPVVAHLGIVGANPAVLLRLARTGAQIPSGQMAALVICSSSRSC